MVLFYRYIDQNEIELYPPVLRMLILVSIKVANIMNNDRPVSSKLLNQNIRIYDVEYVDQAIWKFLENINYNSFVK